MSAGGQTRRNGRMIRLANTARRTPGVRKVISTLAPKLRNSSTLQEIAHRLYDPEATLGHSVIPLHGGRYLTGSGVSRLPILAFVAPGLDEDTAAALLEEIAELQRRTQAFRPLLVLDTPAFAQARSHGYVVEYVLPEAQWAASLPPIDSDITTTNDISPTEYALYLARQAMMIVEHYRPWQLLHVEGGALSPWHQALPIGMAERLPAQVLAEIHPADGADTNGHSD